MADETLENLSIITEAESSTELMVESEAPPAESAGPTTQQSDVTPPEPEPQKTVPLAALHEERARRKELEAAQREQAERFAKLEERLARLQEPPEPEGPSYEENPGEYLKRRVEAQDKDIKDYRDWKAQQEQASRMQQFEQMVQAKEYEYSQAQPDYLDAAKFLRESRMKEYMLAGYTPEQAAASVNQERLALSHNAMMRDQNPGEVFYNLAKGRGFGGQNGDMPAAAPAKAPSPNLEQLAKKMEKTTGLGTSGGTSQGRITAQQLLEMDDDEFAEMTKGRRWQSFWQ